MKKGKNTNKKLNKLISEGVKKIMSENDLKQNAPNSAPLRPISKKPSPNLSNPIKFPKPKMSEGGAPAPTTTPTPTKTPSKTPNKLPNPIKIPKPGTFPKPNPKAVKDKNKKVTSENALNEWFRYLKLEQEKYRMKRLINEAPPMDIEPGDHQPHPSIRRGIEGQSDSPFSAIDLFSKQILNKSTLEKIGEEEFNSIVRHLDTVGKMSMNEIQNALNMIIGIEMRHRGALENLAKQIVKSKFGLSDEIMQMIDAKLKNPGEIDEPDDDDDTPQEEAEAQFTPEELEVIKKNVDKRIVNNTLMMGAGYRAHKVFNELKNALDGIDERLYPLYQRMMPNVEIFMWKMPVEEMFGARQMWGKSQIKCDGETCKAEAEAIIFPVLLHEVAKAAVEILFLQHLSDVQEKHGESVAKEVVKQADSYYDEHWLKLIGPQFWKYLHDALSFVVEEEGEDYTVIAYVLNRMASMEPEEFMALMDDTIHDGPRAIEKIKQIVRQVSDEIESYENQGEDVPKPEEMFPADNEDEIARLLAQNQDDLLTRTPDEERPREQAMKQLSDMDITELNDELGRALEYEDYAKAAQVRDEINRR